MRTPVFLRLFVLFLLIVPQFLFAQLKTITGTITDDKGAPVAGATVNVKGTKASVITNDQGIYVLQTSVASPVLVVTSVGFTQLEVSGAAAQKITLVPSTTTLNDVVVIGYGTARRSNVTSAIASVSEKDIKNLLIVGADQTNISQSNNFKYLSFWIHGGSTDYPLWISTNASEGGFASFNDYDKIMVPANVWTYFKLPVADLKLWATADQFNQIGWRIQGPNNQDEVFTLDDVIFIK